MSDITLNGVSLNELRKTKALIQKDASKFIADGLKDVATLIQSIKDADEETSTEEVEAAAAQAKGILENIRLVSGVSDVTYYLPYSDEGYYDETPYSRVLEDYAEERDVSQYEGALGDLVWVLEDMEYASKKWHKSYC